MVDFGLHTFEFTKCGESDKVQFGGKGTRAIESNGVVKRRGDPV